MKNIFRYFNVYQFVNTKLQIFTFTFTLLSPLLNLFLIPISTILSNPSLTQILLESSIPNSHELLASHELLQSQELDNRKLQAIEQARDLTSSRALRYKNMRMFGVSR